MEDTIFGDSYNIMKHSGSNPEGSLLGALEAGPSKLSKLTFVIHSGKPPANTKIQHKHVLLCADEGDMERPACEGRQLEQLSFGRVLFACMKCVGPTNIHKLHMFGKQLHVHAPGAARTLVRSLVRAG